MIRGIQSKEERGITLIALVVTIIVLIVLAGIAISMTVGDNGIFAKAKEAKRLQITTEAKEKIGTEILAAQVEAIERNEELEQAQVEDIISKYGTLQDDKDTIILKDNGYEISLLDIYQGTTTSSGSYTENKAKIELLEGQVKRLQEQLDSMSQTGDEKDKKIAELNERVTTIENEKNKLQNENNALTSKATELTDLKETLSKVTATEGQILKNYTAYKDGKLITGTMANYAGKTQDATSTSDDNYTYLSIPNAGYYTTASKLKTLNGNLGKDIDFTSVKQLYASNLLSPTNRTYTYTATNDHFVMAYSTGSSGTNNTLTTTLTINGVKVASAEAKTAGASNANSAIVFYPIKNKDVVTVYGSVTTYHGSMLVVNSYEYKS